ncbi:MAG TPA: hypothetical protein VLI04_17090 [Nocardioidaceae bacterium]|nr:hypothetical protein [Nocardioidaceae bacterium]
MTTGAAEAGTSLWSGYRIDNAPTADGGFMGARLVDGKVTYRIDADARRTPTGYGRVRRVVGDRQTARAAWILSKYGDVQLADQAAAVDVATYALLSGKPLSGRRATARLRQTGRPAAIRAIAKQLLDLSKRLAGPYTLTVATTPGVVGGQVSVKVRVTSSTGAGVAKLPVLLTLPGVAETHETTANGRVATTFPAEQVGLRKLRVTVNLVPEWRLSVRKPLVRRASRIALAGRKTTLSARTLLAVRATPTVSIPAVVDPRETGKPFAPTFTVSGSEGVPSREVTLSLFGPFLVGQTPACVGTSTYLTSTVTADGTYTGPAIAVSKAGRYLWHVRVDESTLNAPAEACGGLVRVRTTPRLKLDAQAGPKLAFTVEGLPAGYADDAVLKLFGPYDRRADATCKPGKKVGQVEVRVNRNGDFAPRKIAASEPGVYAWRIQLPAGDLVVPTQTRCGVKGSFSDVS